MAEPAMLNAKSIKKIVKIDGNTWEYIEPGIGATSRLSQHFARIKLFGKRAELINKKIDDDTATEEELDRLEEYLDKVSEHENGIYEIFSEVYRDGTKDNKSVIEWLKKTPEWKLEEAFKEIAGNDEKSRETKKPA